MPRPLRSFTIDPSVADHKLATGTWKRVLSFAKPYRLALTIFLALIVIDALLGAAGPLLFRAIIDDGIANQDTGLVITLASIIAGLAVVSSAVGLIQRYFSSRIGEGLIYDLRTQVFDHVQRMPIGFFTRAQTGALVSRLNGDIQGAQQAFTSTLSSVVGNVVGVAATLTAMFILSWQITLVSLVLVPVFVLPARFVGRKLAVITRERYALNAAMSQTMTERFNVSGALLVKLFGQPDHESQVYADRAGRVRDIGVTQSMYQRFFMSSLGLLASIAVAIAYGVGGVMAAQGTMQVGTVVALTAYLGRLYGPLTSLSNVQVDVMTTMVSFERVLEVLDLEPMINEPIEPATMPSGPIDVRFDRVGFRYPTATEVSLASLEGVAKLDSHTTQDILHDVMLNVPAGQTLAVVGPSGAGKTTLAGLVSRLYDPTAGSVYIGGVDLRDLRLRDITATVGVVSQDAHLFHDSLRSNLLYAKPDASDAELIDALTAAQVWPVIERLPDGLDTVVGDRGHRLSGGEKQRVAIARLLLKNPAVVVLDEATAHLDSSSEAAVQQALAAAMDGRTSIVIAHRLATVRDADQIAVVDAGRIVEHGTHDALLELDGLYATLSRTQFASESPRPDAPQSDLVDQSVPG